MNRRTNILTLASVALLTLSLQSCWVRLADLTVVSNRNYDKSENYVELQRYVKAKGKKKRTSSGREGAMEIALDKAIRQVNGGEFMKNAVIDVSITGKKVRITGDVWGVKK